MLQEHKGSVPEGFRVPVNDFMNIKICRQKSKKSRNFHEHDTILMIFEYFVCSFDYVYLV